MKRSPVSQILESLRNGETDAQGKLFDLVLIWSILLSVAAVMLDSVRAIREAHGGFLTSVEWFFTIMFTIEYVLRLSCIGRPWRYATSFFGVIDLLAILPQGSDQLAVGTQVEAIRLALD